MTNYELLSIISGAVALAISGVALCFAVRATRANETSAREARRANDLFVGQSFLTWWASIIQEIEKANLSGKQEASKALSYTAEVMLVEFCDRFIDDEATTAKVCTYIRGIFQTDPETGEKFLQHILKDNTNRYL